VQCMGQGAARSLSAFGEEKNGARLLRGRVAWHEVPALLESGVGEESGVGKVRKRCASDRRGGGSGGTGGSRGVEGEARSMVRYVLI
jgi:hypothetical protein